jgi:hypothetical protein
MGGLASVGAVVVFLALASLESGRGDPGFGSDSPSQPVRTNAPELPRQDTNGLIEKKIQEVLHADDAWRAHPKYRALFKMAGIEGLQALRLHRKESIALQAAWEEVALTVPEKEPKRTVRPDRHKLDWFLGFLEGRARVQIPHWWAEALLDVRANRRDNIYALMPKEADYHEAGLDNAHAPCDTALKRVAGKVVLKIGKDSLAIPEDLLDKSDCGKVSSNVSALFGPRRCYLAVHEDGGFPYQLACLDRESGKVIWKAGVWGPRWGLTAEGIHYMRVAVTEQDNRVVLFGLGTTGLQVEAFRAENGRHLFRFATSY